MNAELKRVLCKFSLQCGMKPDRKVVPRFICFWALWGPTGRSLSTLPQQMWTETGIYLPLPTTSISHPTPLAGSEHLPGKSLQSGLEIPSHQQASSSFAMNIPCSSGLGRNCWRSWCVPNASELGFFSTLGCGKGRAWITPKRGWKERYAYSSQNVLPKLLIYMSAKWNRRNSSWSLQEKVLTRCQSSALKLCNLKCVVCRADPARLLVLVACVAVVGAGQVWPGERKGDTSLIFLCPSVRRGLCSSQSKAEDEDVVLHRDCFSVCVCACVQISPWFVS